MTKEKAAPKRKSRASKKGLTSKMRVMERAPDLLLQGKPKRERSCLIITKT